MELFIVISSILLTVIAIFDHIEDRYENFSPRFWLLSFTIQAIVVTPMIRNDLQGTSQFYLCFIMLLPMWVMFLAFFLSWVIRQMVSYDALNSKICSIRSWIDDTGQSLLTSPSNLYRYIKKRVGPPSPYDFTRKPKPQPVPVSVTANTSAPKPLPQLPGLELLRYQVRSSFDQLIQLKIQYDLPRSARETASLDSEMEVFIENEVWKQQMQPLLDKIIPYHQQSKKVQTELDRLQDVPEFHRKKLSQALKNVVKLIARFESDLKKTIAKMHTRASDAIQKGANEAYQDRVVLLNEKQAQFQVLQAQYQQVKTALKQQETTPWQKLQKLWNNPFEAVFWLLGNQQDVDPTLKALQNQMESLKQQIIQKTEELEELEAQIERCDEMARPTGTVPSIWMTYDLIKTDVFWDTYENLVQRLKQNQSALIQQAG